MFLTTAMQMFRWKIKNIFGYIFRQFLFKLFVKRGDCVVLMFHRVISDRQKDFIAKDLTISTEKFESLLSSLKKYFIIADLYKCIKSPIYQRCCAITFDDGWIDNYQNAFPILKKFNIPATIFISAGMIGTKEMFWFHRLNNIIMSLSNKQIVAYFSKELGIHLSEFSTKEELNWTIAEELKNKTIQEITSIIHNCEIFFSIPENSERNLLDWTEIKEMSFFNVSFGSHGLNHSIFTKLPKENLEKEVYLSQNILKSKEINYVPIISFPNGTYDQEVIDTCEDSGYEALLTDSIKKCGDGKAKMLIHRIGVNNNVNLNQLFFTIFKAKIKKKFLSQPG